nr:GDP-6-deoxy-D-mannose reductase [uncultured bacterium]
MRRVLITGMQGFIGRHVSAGLRSRGADVIDARRSGACELLREDGRTQAMDGIHADTLVHLAWVTAHGENWTSDLNRDWEIATADLIARFFARGGRRVIATGSCAEYDWTQGGVLSENAPLVPHTPYGAAKARTGEALLKAADDHGASAAWARVFFLFGNGEPSARLVPSMLDACLKRKALACGPHNTVRDFWDVRNLGDALAALALSDLSGPVNVASGRGVSFSELGELIEKITGVDGMIHFDERPLGEGEPPTIVADTARLRSELDFTESIPLETGLLDYRNALAGTI